jgi:hypothetical protein
VPDVRRFCSLLALLLLAHALPGPTRAEEPGIVVLRGPTPIPDGACRGDDDLTLVTPHFAITFAVTTLPPWGVPPGSILDAAPVADGRVQPDRIGFIDFMPGGWEAWENTSHQVDLLEQSPQRVVVEVRRDFRGLQVTTHHEITADSPFITVTSTITNPGTEARSLRSGHSLCTRNGTIFQPPSDPAAANEWIAGYGPGWAVGLSVPRADVRVGGDSWRDLYHLHTLPAGSNARFQGRFHFAGDGSIAGLLRLQRPEEPFGTISGTARLDSGAPLPGATILAERDGVPTTWTVADPDGRYALPLPVGSWTLRATAPDHGWSPPATVAVTEQSNLDLDLEGIGSPGSLTLHVVDSQGAPLDARIRRIAPAPAISYLEQHVRFTDWERPGTAAFPLPPGKHLLAVDAGGIGARPVTVELQLAGGEHAERTVRIETALDLAAAGWHCADLHHHTNLADGVSTPAEVVLSQRAAGLSFASVTDHDLVTNHEALLDAATARGLPAILGIEVSPPWGHFNLFPLPTGFSPGIRSMATTPAEILGRAAALGVFAQVNHPWESGNAYFRSWLRNALPGPVDRRFHFVELNADNGYGVDDRTTLAQLFLFWNDGERTVVTAGSDTHDVYSTHEDEHSGAGRTCAWLGDAPPTVDAFFAALTAGRAFATLGPAVVTSPAPGTVQTGDGGLSIRLQAYAAAGLDRIEVYRDGQLEQTLPFEPGTDLASIILDLEPADASWFNAVVFDLEGAPAVLNPWWLDGGPTP